MKSLLLIALGCVALQGATLTVTDSITGALARANHGDTILVPGPRIYSEHLVVDKTVTLAGTNAPVINGDGMGTTLLVTAPGVRLTGLALCDSGSNLAANDSGIRIEADQVTVEDCQVENDGFGIYLRGASQCTLARNRVSGTSGRLRNPGNGIHLWKTKGNHIFENSIRRKRDGIYLSYADKNRIERNSVRESRFGIHYMYSHYNELSGNRLVGNTVGATLMFARHCLVRENHATGNLRHGILLKQVESSRIIGNIVSGQNRGFFVQQAVQDHFENNLIMDNQIGLYLSGGSEENVFVRNSFVSNVDQVWQPSDEMDRGAAASNRFHDEGEGNYWSDYTGTDQNQDGRGDTPYYETDLYGYLLERHPEVRFFASSPAVALLRQGEKHLPLMNLRGVADLYPLMHRPLVQLSKMTLAAQPNPSAP